MWQKVRLTLRHQGPYCNCLFCTPHSFTPGWMETFIGNTPLVLPCWISAQSTCSAPQTLPSPSFIHSRINSQSISISQKPSLVLYVTYLVPFSSCTRLEAHPPGELQGDTSGFVVCWMEYKTEEARWGGRSHCWLSDLVNHNWFAHLNFFLANFASK